MGFSTWMIAMISGYFPQDWDTRRRLDITCLQLHVHKEKLSMAPSLNSDSVRDIFLLVQLGSRVYSLEQSLWLLGYCARFGIDSCISPCSLRSRRQNRIKLLRILFGEMPVWKGESQNWLGNHQNIVQSDPEGRRESGWGLDYCAVYGRFSVTIG